MKKRPIVITVAILICLGLLAVVLRQFPFQTGTGSGTIQPTSTADREIFPDLIQLADPDTAQSVTTATGFSLKTGIREAELLDGHKTGYLNLMLVSSGVFDTLVILDHPVDVVYAYLLTKNGVVRLPAAIGFRDGENYYALDGSASTFAPADRDATLQALHQAMPKGQTFGISISGASYADGVRRSNCAADWAPAWCALAVQYNQRFDDAERQFLSRIVTDKTWMPVGWLITLYPAEDKQFSQVIALP